MVEDIRDGPHKISGASRLPLNLFQHFIIIVIVIIIIIIIIIITVKGHCQRPRLTSV